MFLDPKAVLDQIDIQPHMAVADFGAGSGFYTIALAKMLQGSNGKVYSLEVQRELLARIKSQAEREHLTNIEYLWSNIEKHGGTKLADHIIDRAIASNILFQVEDKDGFIKELARILKPDGKVALIDWSESYGGMGPAPSEVISRIKALDLFRPHGFVEDKSIDAGVHHYGILLKRN